MNHLEVLGVYREQMFSPGKIRDDAAILDMTLASLANLGCKVASMAPESIEVSTPRPNCVVTMAQSPRSLEILDEWQKQGTRVINSAKSIRNCYRKPLIRLLKDAGIRMPFSRMISLEITGENLNLDFLRGIWLKRGDVHAMQAGDVVFLRSNDELSRALAHFRRHKIKDLLVQEHVDGQVVKFYGVGQKEYFKAFIAATDEDITSFVEPLRELAEEAAKVTGLEVYGGDAVLTNQNEFLLIDLNDWPSFSRCCSAAAGSIASYLVNGMTVRH